MMMMSDAAWCSLCCKMYFTVCEHKLSILSLIFMTTYHSQTLCNIICFNVRGVDSSQTFGPFPLQELNKV